MKRYTTNNTQRAIAAQERIADAQERFADAQERIADAQKRSNKWHEHKHLNKQPNQTSCMDALFGLP